MMVREEETIVKSSSLLSDVITVLSEALARTRTLQCSDGVSGTVQT